MEDYLDHYFSASSWSDVNLIERSSWLHNAPIQPNLQLPNHTGLYQGDDIDSPVSMINSTLSFDGSAAEDAPFLVPGGAASCAIDHGVLPGEASHYVECSNDSIISSKGAFNGGDLTPSHSLGESGYIEIADPITCEFGGPLGEFETFSPLPQAGLPFQSCDDTVSLSSLIGQNGRHSSNLLGGQADDDEGGNINRYVDIDNIVKPENLCTSVTEENRELQNYILPSVAAGYQITDKMIGLASLSQTESPTPNFNSNGTTKPRVRARRGQATDPHSIAERLRRERIAERMKNLQELVPNSHKTDKASMLDEIIEYVKFLQMQVKVLSMSRVGATEAVVPLITDGQAEVWNRTHVSPSADQTAFEQEVVKLMESNVTRAMQYLQTKGLCLMPIALATAISKGSAALKSDEKKPDNGNSLVHNNGSSSSSDSNSSLAAGVRTNHFTGKDTAVVGKIKREGSSSNGFDDIAKPKS